MSRPHRFLFSLLLAGLSGVAHARLGESLAQIAERFGKPVATPKNTAYWLFEVGDSGQVQYTVTFGTGGKSIAEGLRPLRNARFTANIANDFIAGQLEDDPASTTRRTLKASEQYTFAGQTMAVGANEYVVIDEARGLLIVWSRAAKTPYVLVLSPEMMKADAAAKK